MNKIYKMWLAFNFFRKTNMRGTYSLVSYHHPDSITWQLCIHWSKPERIEILPKFGPSFQCGKKYFVGNKNFGSRQFGAWLVMPIIGSFSITTQQKMSVKYGS